MSDFFAPPPRREPEPDFIQPAWIGPPENELGVAVPLRVVLARSEDLVVAVVEVVAFTTGLEFAVEVRLRLPEEVHDPFGFGLRHNLRDGEEIPKEVFRFGLELADGGKATNLDRFPGSDVPPGAPVLMQRGGGGGGRSWSFRYWLWPLPPAGSLAVVVEWPLHSIPLTRVDLDADPLREAAAGSEVLWPGGGASSHGGFITQLS